MNITGYVPIPINTLDTVVRGSNTLSLVAVITRSKLLDVVAREVQHSHRAADSPKASGGGGVPPGSNSSLRSWIYRLELEALLLEEC